MRQHEVHPVLAQLEKHVGKAQCREVLELIEIDVEISPLVFGNVRPASPIRETSSAPRRAAVSSPMRPLARLTSRIFPSSITVRRSKLLFCWSRIAPSTGSVTNAPTLF